MSSEAASIAARLAERLPERELRSMAAALLDTGGLAGGRGRAASGAVRAAYDELAQLLSRGGSPELLAGCLLGASRAVVIERARQHIDVVWTGPTSGVRTSRLTSAVVVDLIDAATEEVLLVSFATQTEPAVATALVTAVQRGADITMLLERAADNPAYRSWSDPFPAVGGRRLAWPVGSRPPGASMHAKLLVIDRVAALVGSANVTGHAMAANLECGVLIRGGDAPSQIRAHVMSLVDRGDLVVASDAPNE